MVFDDEHFPYFESAFESYILRRNSYGGLRLHVNDLAIDAWPLSATWAFREGHIREPSFEKLPSTTFLNIDGVIVEVTPAKGKRRRIFENGFFSGWKEKTLDINLLANPYPSICVVRTLRISKHFGFLLSHRLVVYMWDMLGRIAIPAFEKAQLKHYGQIEFEAKVLRDLRQHLEKHLASGSTFPFALFPARPEQMELHDSDKNQPGLDPSMKFDTRNSTMLYSARDPEEIFMENLLEDTFDMLKTNAPKDEVILGVSPANRNALAGRVASPK